MSFLNEELAQIPPSKVSLATFNPIRQIVDSLVITPNPSKKFISLGLGDPTLFGNLKINQRSVDAISENLYSYKYNGYAPSVGSVDARKAIARSYGIDYEDVYIASGCSDALNLAITVLANENENIIIPKPGFSLYETLATSKGIKCKFYDLLPDRQWEMDLVQLEGLIDGDTRAIVLNNPSNPCGSNFSREHLLGIISLRVAFLEIAERHQIPIISDEIYADMVAQV
jgi:tyrosine aminotransferase